MVSIPVFQKMGNGSLPCPYYHLFPLVWITDTPITAMPPSVRPLRVSSGPTLSTSLSATNDGTVYEVYTRTETLPSTPTKRKSTPGCPWLLGVWGSKCTVRFRWNWDKRSDSTSLSIFRNTLVEKLELPLRWWASVAYQVCIAYSGLGGCGPDGLWSWLFAGSKSSARSYQPGGVL